MKAWLRSHAVDVALMAVGIGIAVALRIALLDFKSVDYFNYTKDWYNTLKAEGFSAFSHGFANYNLPYLYLLYGIVRFLPDVPPFIAIKIPSLIADFVAAWFVFRIVSLGYQDRFVPLMAAFAALVVPTLVLNSAFWGQADAVYACVVLASVYYLVRRQDNIAMLLYGFALALKAQAIFLLPLLGALVFRHEIRWRTLAWVPLILLAVLIPALIAGRPFLELLLIYPSQAGQYEQLTMHAPSSLAWIPDGGRFYPYFYSSGLITAVAMVIAYSWAVYRGPGKLSAGLMIELALISAILVPFFLPKMHERYFYLADLLSVIFAFFVPSFWLVPILMITISFFAYQPTLFGVEPIPMGLLALGVFILLIFLLRHALRQLFPGAADN